VKEISKLQNPSWSKVKEREIKTYLLKLLIEFWIRINLVLKRINTLANFLGNIVRALFNLFPLQIG